VVFPKKISYCPGRYPQREKLVTREKNQWNKNKEIPYKNFGDKKTKKKNIDEPLEKLFTIRAFEMEKTARVRAFSYRYSPPRLRWKSRIFNSLRNEYHMLLD